MCHVRLPKVCIIKSVVLRALAFNFIAKHWATFSTVPAIPLEIQRKLRCICTGRGLAQRMLRAQPQLPPNFAPGQVEFLANSLNFAEILHFSRRGLPIMADDTKKGQSKKGSAKSQHGKSSDSAGKQKFSSVKPSTAFESEPPCLTPHKLDSQPQSLDPRVDLQTPPETLADPSTDHHSVGPFQGQDDSTESITGAPPGVSTVHTPVSRRQSDADKEALTQHLSDEARFQEERARKTDTLLVTFLSKAKGAPPAVLNAWGIPHPQEEVLHLQSSETQPGQASQDSEFSQAATSSGNRDVPSMKSQCGHFPLCTPHAHATT